MSLRLSFLDGPLAGKELAFEPGQEVSFGRGEDNTVPLTDDFVSKTHFTVAREAPHWRITDAGSRNGTLVNNEPLKEAVSLKDADVIQAGRSRIRVNLEDELTPPERLIRRLRAEKEPLYAVLDAARSPEIFELLRKTGETRQSLYEGKPAQDFAAVAPYLARLTPSDTLLQSLVYGGWGQAWGIFLCTQAPFEDLRRHLRRFLKVATEDNRTLYFRFYDPRVLRVYLPTCTPQEAAQFFGPVRAFLIEDEEPRKLLRFTPSPKGVQREAIEYAKEAGGAQDPQ